VIEIIYAPQLPVVLDKANDGGSVRGGVIDEIVLGPGGNYQQRLTRTVAASAQISSRRGRPAIDPTVQYVCAGNIRVIHDGSVHVVIPAVAAERPGTVSGVDEALVGKAKQFVVERVEEHAAEIGGGPTEGHAEVGAADVADGERVVGENGMRLGVAGVEIEDKKRDGFGSVTGSFERFETDAAEFDDVAVVKWSEGVIGTGSGAEIDGSADAGAEFEMAGEEIGVEMGEEDVLDGEGVLGSEGAVLVDITLRIDDGGGAGGLISDEIVSVNEARKIELHGERRRRSGLRGRVRQGGDRSGCA